MTGSADDLDDDNATGGGGRTGKGGGPADDPKGKPGAGNQ